MHRFRVGGGVGQRHTEWMEKGGRGREERVRRKARREAGKYRIEIQEDKKERRQGGKKNKKTCEEGGLVGGTIEDGQRKRGGRGRERGTRNPGSVSRFRREGKEDGVKRQVKERKDQAYKETERAQREAFDSKGNTQKER